ncbi:MAG: recombinase family protein [Anaerolineales bacterium]|nr:recombinase family protein [Anaerolineales bacterium]
MTEQTNPINLLGNASKLGGTKVTASHLQRAAFLYVRQSTLHQVVQNTESTQRQYALQQQAVALGWPIERVHVIDCDLGQSGATAVDRAGFQQLVAEVSLGNAGIVLGLEVSRLALSQTPILISVPLIYFKMGSLPVGTACVILA